MDNTVSISTPLDLCREKRYIGLTMSRSSLMGKLNIRADPKSDFISKLEENLDIKFPLAPNTSFSKDDFLLIWLGPNEWQLNCGIEKEEMIYQKAIDVMDGNFASVNKISDYYINIKIFDKNALRILKKGCPLNFDQHMNKPGDCAQTYIAKTSVLIVKSDDKPTFDIQVRWSFAEYLWNWLESAGFEFKE